MEVTTDYSLPYGRDVEQVWETIDFSDEHSRTCPHCAAVRESLLVLRAATDEMVRQEIEPPSDLVSWVMSAVRADVRRTDVVPLPGDGLARMSTRAIAALLRYAADSVDGVRARTCRVVEAPESTSDDPLIEVELHIAISAGLVTHETFSVVRQRILTAVSARIGVRLARLDLVVSDVLEG